MLANRRLPQPCVLRGEVLEVLVREVDEAKALPLDFLRRVAEHGAGPCVGFQDRAVRRTAEDSHGAIVQQAAAEPLGLQAGSLDALAVRDVVDDRMANLPRPVVQERRIDFDVAKAAVGQAVLELEAGSAPLPNGGGRGHDLFAREGVDRLDGKSRQSLGRVAVELDGRRVGGKDGSPGRVDLQHDRPVVGKQPAVGLLAFAELGGPILDLAFQPFLRSGNGFGHGVEGLGEHTELVVAAIAAAHRNIACSHLPGRPGQFLEGPQARAESGRPSHPR